MLLYAAIKWHDRSFFSPLRIHCWFYPSKLSYSGLLHGKQRHILAHVLQTAKEKKSLPVGWLHLYSSDRLIVIRVDKYEWQKNSWLVKNMHGKKLATMIIRNKDHLSDSTNTSLNSLWSHEFSEEHKVRRQFLALRTNCSIFSLPYM
jgi:hypothetical protein